MATKNVVLVHGGFVDGSGWQGVHSILSNDGYKVSVVQNPTLSLEGDVEATNRVIDAQGEPVILVGHSYGGVVITEAGNNANVEKLVYIVAFAPDQGESVETPIADPPPDAPGAASILPPQDGFLFLDAQVPPLHSPLTSAARTRRSWADSQSRGASKPSAGRSARRRGRTSRVGISSPPRIG